MKAASALLTAAILMLSACAHTGAQHTAAPEPLRPAAPSQASPKLDMQGQMSIKLQAFADQPAKGISLGFFFTGNQTTGQLDLMTPLGSEIAQVQWTPEGVWLINDKGRQSFDSLASLSEAALGEALPLRILFYWLQGLPDPAQPSVPGAEPDTFVQAGWTVDTRPLIDKKLLVQRTGTETQRGAFIKVYLDR